VGPGGRSGVWCDGGGGNWMKRRHGATHKDRVKGQKQNKTKQNMVAKCLRQHKCNGGGDAEAWSHL
jgi:hypothetical protein